MSLRVPREPRHVGHWEETIRYAIDTTPRTIRLCLILLVVVARSGLIAAVAELLWHMLLSTVDR
jgi:hypothetical protein